jgi:phosphate transport system protein
MILSETLGISPKKENGSMQSYLEESFRIDIDRIRSNIVQMADFVEESLHNSIKAFTEFDHQLAYAVILRDLYVDEKEKEIDRLCIDFFVRRQPVAFPVRFAYSAVKLNLEIERIGDYAESIARMILKMKEKPAESVKDGIIEIADLSTAMFHDSILSFVKQDPELAKKAIAVEDTVDLLRLTLNKRLVELLEKKTITFDMFEPLMGIIRRFERVSDQARNICMEVLYMCTGEQVKHPGAEAFRILFVDDHDRCRSRMAEAVALSYNNPRFIFTSAGHDPESKNGETKNFLNSKGFEVSDAAPKAVLKIPNIDHYQVIVALSPEAGKMFHQGPSKTIFLDWSTDDPSTMAGDQKTIYKAYEKTFTFIKAHVNDLVKAILGTETPKEVRHVS